MIVLYSTYSGERAIEIFLSWPNFKSKMPENIDRAYSTRPTGQRGPIIDPYSNARKYKW